jgi:hypothetical protein
VTTTSLESHEAEELAAALAATVRTASTYAG